MRSILEETHGQTICGTDDVAKVLAGYVQMIVGADEPEALALATSIFVLGMAFMRAVPEYGNAMLDMMPVQFEEEADIARQTAEHFPIEIG